MTLSLYIARRFLRAFVMILAIFWAILFMIDMLEEIRRFQGLSLRLRDLALLSALNVPGSLYSLLPLLMMLSAVMLFLGLARSSELVVIRAAGRSALRMLLAPAIVAAALGLLAVAVGNPIVSATAKRYAGLAASYQAEGGQTVSVGSEGLWMRQSASYTDSQGKSHPAQAVIRAGHSNDNATDLHDVTFLILDRSNTPVRRIEAERATLSPGHWTLSKAKDWPLGQSTNPERDARSWAELELPSSLTAERIRDSFGTPSSVSIWNLPGFIASLKAAGISARPHRVWLQMELALPAVLVAMVLIAAGFTMRHVRFGGTGRMVLYALAAGLAVFFLRNITQVLGDNGQIPVALAAWAPPGVALSLGLALLLHLEDG